MKRKTNLTLIQQAHMTQSNLTRGTNLLFLQINLLTGQSNFDKCTSSNINAECLRENVAILKADNSFLI